MERIKKLSDNLSPATGTRFVLDNCGCLSQSQQEEYNRNGFLVVKRLFTPEDLKVYMDRFEAVTTGGVETPAIIMKDVALVKGVKEKSSQHTSDIITKVQDFQDDPEFFSFCTHSKLKPYVRSFCGSNFRSIHTMLINKPPDLGSGTSRHPLHQDLYYFPLQPPERIVAAWVAMETINRENGCLSVLPGSHLGTLRPHGYPKWEGGVNYLYHGITSDIDLDQRVFLHMEQGDCVFFHPLLIHGSGRNSSGRFRKAISCHFASGDLTHFALEEAQKSLLEESLTNALKNANMTCKDMSEEFKFKLYCYFWKLKSRQISGEETEQWKLDDDIVL